jgi:hypothetical protein
LARLLAKWLAKGAGEMNCQRGLPKRSFWDKRSSFEKIFGFKRFPKNFLKYTERLIARNFFEKERSLAKRSF